MRVLLTGGTGFIGVPLTETLLARGYHVIVLSRQALIDRPGCRFISSLDRIPVTEELDAVINLAGASLAARRWNESYKGEIISSRMDITAQLLALMARLSRPPKVLLSASAIGYYGHHDDELLTESSSATPGFAQKLCSDWEALALTAQSLGVRVCLLRLGVVLDDGGGALAEMTKSFRFGVASWLGSGNQWLSWVHREDVIRAIGFLLARDDLQGPFNITAPEPATALEFARALTTHHRTFLQTGVPASIARLLLGEMAPELLLNGQRVFPAQLQHSGFEFSYPDTTSALAAIYATATKLTNSSSE
ncbi:MAG: TIGR01777 family oxidoreductase [Halioglobus sp.]|nr:TIGR01777 family oxidoreductase [Halioglobus sp.]